MTASYRRYLAAWNSVRPELEQVLRSRREIGRKRATAKDRFERENELLRLYGNYTRQHFSWNRYDMPLCIRDLYEIPMVLDMIEEDDCRVKITEERWQKIENELPELLAIHARKVEFGCAKLLLSAQEQPDEFAYRDPAIWESLEIDSTVDTDVVWGGNAFFGTNLNPRVMITFSEILSCREEYMCSRWLPSWKSAEYQVERLVVQTADALLSSMGFPDDMSMRYMQYLGASFVCLQCDPILRVRLTWEELVKHVSEEIRDNRDHPPYEAHKLKSDGTIATHDLDFIYPSHELRRNSIWST
ncbi:hypothetical protein ACEPAI_2142 [Sanghuangporus weigelae]